MFIDPKTVSKMVFITGDVSEGSANDLKLREMISSEWKVGITLGFLSMKSFNIAWCSHDDSTGSLLYALMSDDCTLYSFCCCNVSISAANPITHTRCLQEQSSPHMEPIVHLDTNMICIGQPCWHE